MIIGRKQVVLRLFLRRDCHYQPSSAISFPLTDLASGEVQASVRGQGMSAEVPVTINRLDWGARNPFKKQGNWP
jgi:hypothetical protein